MAYSVVSRFRSLTEHLDERFREESDRLESLQEQLGVQEQRVRHLKELKETLSLAEEPLSSLEALPDSDNSSSVRRHRTPIPTGQGTRLGYDVLRRASQPLSLHEIAVEVLSGEGIDQPTDAEIKALEANLRRPLREQVEKGMLEQHMDGRRMRFSVPRTDAQSLPGGTPGAGS